MGGNLFFQYGGEWSLDKVAIDFNESWHNESWHELRNVPDKEATMSIYMYWPIALAVGAEILYQISAKSTPQELNPFASLTITYLIGAAICAIIFLVSTKGGNILHEWSHANWTMILLGFAIVGLEAGSIFMYRVGWNVNTGYIVKGCFMAVALLLVGYFLYKEQISGTKIAGIAVCMIGLFLINR